MSSYKSSLNFKDVYIPIYIVSLHVSLKLFAQKNKSCGLEYKKQREVFLCAQYTEKGHINV